MTSYITSAPKLKSILLRKNGKDSIELKGLLQNCVVFENIFNNTMTAAISIIDGVGLLEEYPILGDEYIDVVFMNTEMDNLKDYKKTFVIYKIGKVSFDPVKKLKVFEFLCVSEAFDTDLNTNIRRSYSNMTESEIVKKIAQYQLGVDPKRIFVEDSKFKRNFVVPGWRPLQTINYFARTAMRNSKSASPTFLFYEDYEGFHFKSLEFLCEQSPVVTLKTGVMNEMQQLNFNNVEAFTVEEVFNSIENSENGMYAAEVQSIDLFNKKISYKSYDYEGDFKKFKRLDSNPAPFSDVDNASTQRKTVITYNNSDDTKQFKVDALLYRPGLIQEFRNFKINAKVMGNILFRVGQKVVFNIPSYKQTDSYQENAIMSGEWIITALRHSINEVEFNTVLELRKPNIRENK